MGSGGGSSAPAPDPTVGQAALMNAQTGQDWLAFAKDAYGTQTERQGPIDALASQVTQQQLDTAKQQQQWATEAHDRYVDTFQPLQDKYIQQAQDWASPERQQQAAGAAEASVFSNADAAKAATNRQAVGLGINPASGRYAGINRAADVQTAAAAAGAGNNARNLIQSQGIGLLGNAVNVGNGLPAQASQSVGLGLNAGTGAASVTNAANQQALSSYQVMNQGFQGAMQGYTNQANILNNQYQSELSAWANQQQAQAQETSGAFGALGTALGLGLRFAIPSSKKFKTAKRKSTGNLKAVKAMPVERWRYKPGLGDGGAADHTGPYAEDFRKATGLGDGHMIPMQDAVGITMGAVKELAGKVDRIGKAVGLGAAAMQMKKRRA